MVALVGLVEVELIQELAVLEQQVKEIMGELETRLEMPAAAAVVALEELDLVQQQMAVLEVLVQRQALLVHQ
jgi:hypothetical protein